MNNVVVKMKFKPDDLQRLVNMIYSTESMSKLFATIGLRKLLSIENEPPIQQIIDSNLI